MALFLLIDAAGFGLDDLDGFGNLDELVLSLDDAYWAESDVKVIRGRSVSPGGAVVRGRALVGLTYRVEAGFGLEDLDEFGSLDELPFSLDDLFWKAENINIFGRTTSPTGALARGGTTFSSPGMRSVSPTGTYIREYWTIIPKPLRSVSPGSARFNINLVFSGLLRSVSPTGTVVYVLMCVTPVGVPLRFVSPGGAFVEGRFRGHGWITRAV
jgi:hypothetical protein